MGYSLTYVCDGCGRKADPFSCDGWLHVGTKRAQDEERYLFCPSCADRVESLLADPWQAWDRAGER